MVAVGGQRGDGERGPAHVPVARRVGAAGEEAKVTKYSGFDAESFKQETRRRLIEKRQAQDDELQGGRRPATSTKTVLQLSEVRSLSQILG